MRNFIQNGPADGSTGSFYAKFHTEWPSRWQHWLILCEISYRMAQPMAALAHSMRNFIQNGPASGRTGPLYAKFHTEWPCRWQHGPILCDISYRMALQAAERAHSMRYFIQNWVTKAPPVVCSFCRHSFFSFSLVECMKHHRAMKRQRSWRYTVYGGSMTMRGIHIL
ncbi:MAG: hypothetical protein K0R57_2712 [Paenibacillaceae bacterium]|jgi:hypothetical protein|nr:hypothetical protein [Paenibacillaceae bacterium]